jgi:hypothetical protein
MFQVVNEPEEQKFSLKKNQNFYRFWGLVGACVEFFQFLDFFGWPIVKTNGKTRTNSSKSGWIDPPHTQNFEISRANSGVKTIKIGFEIFVKMLDGLNFSKRCL